MSCSAKRLEPQPSAYILDSYFFYFIHMYITTIIGSLLLVEIPLTSVYGTCVFPPKWLVHRLCLASKIKKNSNAAE